ncbi:MAG: TonB-dependent receptor [Dialister sp.]|nr:TonB-dependent receptor [Dialister sp.]
MYTLDAVVVEADKTKNKFGDTITEQSYYRTGGDVKVITREEIEKRHYTDLTEAIKRIPGVTFQNPGYRGGEYGYAAYNNGVSINGDSRVIILVDGRRVDNLASQRISGTSKKGTKSTGVDLDHVTNMENVEKIEVIKGPGASVYGADATGGVINIITRKGGAVTTGSVDLSTGSWDKHNYAVSLSGSAGDDKSFHYFISANRNMSGDTKFKDGLADKVGTLAGSRYKEDGVNVRLDKDFNDTHNLSISYNHKDGRDGYPVTTPNLKYWNEKDWYALLMRVAVGRLDENNHAIEKATNFTIARELPYYRNLFTARALYDVTNDFNHNDLDVVYTFAKDNGMDSFIRFYDQSHSYAGRANFWFSDFASGGGNSAAGSGYDNYMEYVNAHGGTINQEQLNAWMKEHLTPFPGTVTEEQKEWWQNKTEGGNSPVTDYNEEKNRGAQLQLAKTFGNHDVIANVLYDKAKVFKRNKNDDGHTYFTHLSRKTLSAYVQDKIHVTDKWDITPAIRYSKYSSINTTMKSKGEILPSNGKGNTHALTYALNTEYMFNDTASMYLRWTKVFRPLRQGDYSTIDVVTNSPLEDEEGNVYTVGIRKDLSDKTSIAVHYDITKMSNAIATFPVWTGSEFKSAAINAKEDKQSFNITLDHRFNDHLTLSASYTHLKDKWAAKNGAIIDPNWMMTNAGDVNTAINHLRPENYYSLNLSYENGKLYTGLLTNWYTGNDLSAFTSKRFLVMDWNINYDIAKDITAYVLVSNLTNQAYETWYSGSWGPGAYSMPARSFLVGARYKF